MIKIVLIYSFELEFINLAQSGERVRSLVRLWILRFANCDAHMSILYACCERVRGCMSSKMGWFYYMELNGFQLMCVFVRMSTEQKAYFVILFVIL